MLQVAHIHFPAAAHHFASGNIEILHLQNLGHLGQSQAIILQLDRIYINMHFAGTAPGNDYGSHLGNPGQAGFYHILSYRLQLGKVGGPAYPYLNHRHHVGVHFNHHWFGGGVGKDPFYKRNLLADFLGSVIDIDAPIKLHDDNRTAFRGY